jgi:hypothetical protein
MVIVKEIIRTYYNCDENVRLDIDSAISTLSKEGILSDVELVVIAVTKEQYSLIEASKLVGLSKSAIGRKLDDACEKIAVCLGSEYQDDKILDLVESKLGRKLKSDEKKFCWNKIRNFGRDKSTNVNIFNFKNGSRKDKAKR